MCWVITIPGESAGRRVNISLMASVPPVDAPIQISFSVDTRPMEVTGTRTGTGPPTAEAVKEGAVTIRLIWAAAAIRIFSTICADNSLKPSATPILGLATKSTAPNSSAFIVTSAPRSVKVEIMTTGIGRKRISRPKKSMPSMRGISMSRVRTSGFSSRIISLAINGSLAVPTHSMSCCRLMISANKLRTNAESSTTTTRIFFNSISSKQIHRATRRRLGYGRGIAFALFYGQRFRMRMGQPLDQHLAGHREKTNLARVNIQHILRHHRDSLRRQVVQNKFGVAFAHVHGGKTRHDRRAAKHLGLHRLAPCALFQQFVDQQLHGIRTIAPKTINAVAIGQHKVVHTPGPNFAIPDTGRNARTQNGHDDQIFSGHKVLARQHLDRVILKMMVTVKKRSFARVADLRLQLINARQSPTRQYRGRNDHARSAKRQSGSPRCEYVHGCLAINGRGRKPGRRCARTNTQRRS